MKSPISLFILERFSITLSEFELQQPLVKLDRDALFEVGSVAAPSIRSGKESAKLPLSLHAPKITSLGLLLLAKCSHGTFLA
jgi:hypothetical protein